jgi:predicted AAA+ superfamily ATPase
MNIYDFNPWWKTRQVDKTYVGIQRQLFNGLLEYLPVRQMLVITGLRRTGKTTLIYQLIQSLLSQQVPETHILYYSFDEDAIDLETLLSLYQQEVLHAELGKQKVYICLDEIQKLHNWENKLKLFYDRYPNIKFIISGSAQIVLFDNLRESLAGRFFEMRVNPMGFAEYVSFQKLAIDLQQEPLYQQEIKIAFAEYLKTGGFIETFNFSDKLRQEYIKQSLLERILFKDLPETFSITNPSLFARLVKIAATNVGMFADYKNIANDLGADQRTIASYISYLEYAMIQKKLYNYTGNLLKSEKKLKRLYLSNTAFTLALNPNVELGYLLEQYFVNVLQANFFYRSPQKEEIDIILFDDNGVVLPLEVKIKQQIKKRDSVTLLNYLKKNKLSKGIMITLDTEATIQQSGVTIELIPYWKHMTISAKTALPELLSK